MTWRVTRARARRPTPAASERFRDSCPPPGCAVLAGKVTAITPQRSHARSGERCRVLAPSRPGAPCQPCDLALRAHATLRRVWRQRPEEQRNPSDRFSALFRVHGPPRSAQSNSYEDTRRQERRQKHAHVLEAVRGDTHSIICDSTAPGWIVPRPAAIFSVAADAA